MIEFYRPARCNTCAEIEEALQEMVIAHRVIVVEPGRQPAQLGPAMPLPALKDDGRVITGQAAIVAYLQELQNFVSDWRRFQSDACYCDEGSL